MINHHDSLSAELREVEAQHPGWQVTLTDSGCLHAELASSGTALDARTLDRMDEAIAVWEWRHQVKATALQDGDVIVVMHEHDPALGACRIGCAACEAEVCGLPRPAGAAPGGEVQVAVDWCARASDAVTGTIRVALDRMVLCLERGQAAA